MLVAALLCLAGVAAAQYFPATPTNLLSNAGAEDGVTPSVSFVPGSNTNRDGWSIQNGPLSAAGSGTSLSASGLPGGTTIDPFAGNLFFLTDTRSLVNSLLMSQTFDLSTYGSLIDGADCKIQIRGAGFITHPGQAILMQIEFYDDGFASTTGTQFEFYTDDMPLADWIEINNDGLIPALTRNIVVTFAVNCQNPQCASPSANAGFDALAVNVLFNATLHGDPHFVGFDGSKFNFDGVSGEVFGIISDPAFELNALFQSHVVDGVNGTWIAQIGVVSKDFSAVFSPRTGVLVNGITLLDHFSDDLGNMVTVGDGEFTLKSAAGYIVRASVQRSADGFLYLNVNTDLVHIPTAIHGVLGQTAQFLLERTNPAPIVSQDGNGKGVVAGSPSDYIVRDGLLGSDFAFSLFEASESSVRGIDLTETILTASM